jgi:hypothetical protein
VKRTLLVAPALLFFYASARAALSGPPIPNNNYSLDLRRGAVVGGAVVGGAVVVGHAPQVPLLQQPELH